MSGKFVENRAGLFWSRIKVEKLTELELFLLYKVTKLKSKFYFFLGALKNPAQELRFYAGLNLYIIPDTI